MRDETYVLRICGTNRCKIGHSVKVQRRVQQIAASMPVACEQIAVLAGGAKLEQRLHIMLKEYHLRGEWFELPGHVIEALKEGGQEYEKKKETDMRDAVSIVRLRPWDLK
jgi:hypothetical protein